MQKYYGSALTNLYVRRRPGYLTQGLLQAGHRNLKCALGRSGIGIKRGEGDGMTPQGRFLLLNAMIRTDQVPVRHAPINLRPISKQSGWCDGPGDPNYNAPVRLPYSADHEKLWREDHLYDIALVLDFNMSRGGSGGGGGGFGSGGLSCGGSAIFFHLAHLDYRPTEGCIAISRADMLWLLPRIGRQTVIDIV